MFLSYVLGHSDMHTANIYSTVLIVDDTAEKKGDVPVEIPRNTTERDGAGLSRLINTVAKMKRQDVKITVQALKNLGYGGRVITEYKKTNPNY